LEAYAHYIATERRPKQPDLFVLKTLYERAIAEAAKRQLTGENGAEDALRAFWIGYLDFMVIEILCRFMIRK
jgi:squamous cell carcinoma antigen recognized by T-cells 3